jgi:lysophospholipase L1-like esterase
MNVIQNLKEAVYPHTGTPVLAFLGDSVTHGAFACIQGESAGCEFDFEAVYHNRLRKKLLEVNPWLPVSIINAGVAGDTAEMGLARMERDVLSRRPDLCVVNFALNDVNQPLETYVSSLGRVFDRLHEAHIPAILLTPNMLNTYVHPDTIPMYRDYAAVTAAYQTQGRMDAYVDAARGLAAKRGIPVADAYAAWKEMERQGKDTTGLLANYINHPTKEMHTLFADVLFAVLDQDIEA